jgi:hypothetical protein
VFSLIREVKVKRINSVSKHRHEYIFDLFSYLTIGACGADTSIVETFLFSSSATSAL